MQYKITKGIAEEDLPIWLEEAAKRCGSFDDGRIDYTKAMTAPIILCAVVSAENAEVLLVKCSADAADGQSYWSTVNDFIDNPHMTVKEHAIHAVREGLGLWVDSAQIEVGESHTATYPIGKKRAYLVFPCLITLVVKKPKIVLDEKHPEYIWVPQSELTDYEILEDLPYDIGSAPAA